MDQFIAGSHLSVAYIDLLNKALDIWSNWCNFIEGRFLWNLSDADSLRCSLKEREPIYFIALAVLGFVTAYTVENIAHVGAK